MLIQISARLKNGHMTRFREERGLTQKAAAHVADVSTYQWNAAECMRFAQCNWDALKRIAGCIEVPIEELCPEILKGQSNPMRAEMYREAQAERLFAYDKQQQLALPAFVEAQEGLDEAALRERLDKVMRTLTYREREILKLRFGLGENNGHTYTWEEIGKIFKVTRERIRQVGARGIRKMQDPARAAGLVSFAREAQIGGDAP